MKHTAMWFAFTARNAGGFVGIAKAVLLNLAMHRMGQRCGVQRCKQFVLRIIGCVITYQPIQLLGAAMAAGATRARCCQ